jgi:hypothetical protein
MLLYKIRKRYIFNHFRGGNKNKLGLAIAAGR